MGGPPHPPPGARASRGPAGLGWLYSFVWPQRGAIARLVLLAALTTVLSLAQPWLTKLIIDDGLLAGDFDALLTWSACLLALGFGATALSGYNRIQHTRLSGSILFALREDVYAHLQKLGPEFFNRQRTGDLISRVDRDIAEIQRFAVDTLFSAFSAVIGVLGTCTMMLILSWKLSLVLLVIVPLELVYLSRMRPRVERRNRRLRERGADISSFFAEKIPAIKFIQSAGGEERELGILSSLNRVFLGDLIRLQKTEFWTSAIPSLLLSSSRAGAFLLGGYWVIQGEFALGSLIAFAAYLGMATGPLQSLLGLYLAWQRLVVSLERVSYLRQQSTEDSEGAGRTPPASLRGELAFNGIEFSYDPENPVFSGAGLQVPAGSKVGVRGATGAGKSTLLDLVQRHLQPQAGSITVDGINIEEFELRPWRALIAVVPQDPVIFRQTLANNVRYSMPQASEAEVSQACEQAGLADLVQQLPQGLDTVLAERGSSLSGGERQRIALARALLQKPVILLLDEPTSAVDAATELQMVCEVDRLFASTTRIVVSHRPSTLDNADLLITISEGQLVAEETTLPSARHGS